jgi:2-oxoisovalerate dehydrogenase E1 component
MQLLANPNDPFSGGRSYYSHPSLMREGFPTIPHQSSATGMQVIPATGCAHGIKYLRQVGVKHTGEQPVVVCSLGDGSITEGEVAEALQMAVLKKLPIVYLIQDNGWAISASADEFANMDAWEYAAGFKGLKRVKVDGWDFEASHTCMENAFAHVRAGKGPILVHAKVPLLGHHTSGVRKEWYRGEQNLKEHHETDPIPHLEQQLIDQKQASKAELKKWQTEATRFVEVEFNKALHSPDPEPETAEMHVFGPAGSQTESGQRHPKTKEKTMMVDAALHAVEEILHTHPEALFYGQDVGGRLGGVFREAASLAQKFGDHRVFNTPIQEAYIIGSTAGMAVAGAKPIVEIQFADYFWPGLNQLVTEISKCCYLSNGKFPLQTLIRVPIGAYGSGGPYHSGSIESTLLNIRGIKVVYPSNAADMKGLMKAAFAEPNPVVILEHKGLYWSKVPGTEEAKMPEPAADYFLPLGKASIVQEATSSTIEAGDSVVVITYGMGVYWAKTASKKFAGKVEIVDLRTLYPLDETLVMERAALHGKVLVLTEEPLLNSFAESLAARISQACFQQLDAPVFTFGALPVPAIPLNEKLEKAVLPTAAKVEAKIMELLAY